MSYPPQQVASSPEVLPALDEMRPQIGPNLAGDPELCRTVLEHLQRRFVYPQVLQQNTLHPVWRRLYDAWRVKGAAIDLDISAIEPMTRNVNPDGKGRGGLIDRNDGYSSRIYPPTFHKQVKTLIDLHGSISWADGLPVRAMKPETEYEHPLYNPTQQAVDAANEELRNCARDINLKRVDRRGRGSYALYGHVWVAVDFRYEQEDKPIVMLVPQDPMEQQAFGQAMEQRYGQPIAFDGTFATFQQRVIKTMQTDYVPLRVDDVFINLAMEANPEKQPCPCIRNRVDTSVLHGNDYDPQKNPFGWLNCQQALNDQGQQWTFGYDAPYQQQLAKKGLSETGVINAKDSTKHLWVMYPRLALDPATGKLDDGTGIECPTCQGKGRVTVQMQGADEFGQPVVQDTGEQQDCPQCQGRMRVFLKPERYVVVAFGNLDSSAASATCLRIQRNPDPKDKVPLLFSASLSEDTAGAIPFCKGEAALKSADQLATSLMQWFDAKNKALNPQWLIPEDADIRKDYNNPNENIQHFGNPAAFVPMRMQLDPTQNLLPFMQTQEDAVKQVMGANDTLLGDIQSGRRSASEIQNAYDASKTPIIQEIDGYNEDILAQWAQRHLDNMEAWADRDYIRKKTGRTTFGRLELFSAVADEFMKRQAAIGNMQFFLQAIAPLPGVNIMPLAEALGKTMKLPVEWAQVFPDGGMKKARADGLRLVTQILGEGQFIPAQPSDPHEIYIEIFQQALQDPYWNEKTPETLPILQQRLMQQTQLLIMQQQAQLMAQQQSMAQQMALKAPKGNGNQPKQTSAPATIGGQNQQLMGAATPQ